MTEAEEHNEAIFARFKKEAEQGKHKIVCIVAIDPEGSTRVIQSAVYTPKQIADKLFRIANQIIGYIKSKNN